MRPRLWIKTLVSLIPGNLVLVPGLLFLKPDR